MSAHYIGIETNKKTKAVCALARLAYTHNVSPATTVGAEVERNLSDGAIAFSLGYAKKLPSGALTKLKVGLQMERDHCIVWCFEDSLEANSAR